MSASSALSLIDTELDTAWPYVQDQLAQTKLAMFHTFQHNDLSIIQE